MADLGTVNEGATALYTATLKDETGAVLDGTALDSLTLTAYDQASGTILNSRNAQNVKNANGVTVYATLQTIVIDGVTKTYNLAWTLAPADNAIVGSAAIERHVAIFRATWASGAKQCPHELTWHVRNLNKMP